jgi:hypothetical protein
VKRNKFTTVGGCSEVVLVNVGGSGVALVTVDGFEVVLVL